MELRSKRDDIKNPMISIFGRPKLWLLCEDLSFDFVLAGL